MDGKVPWIVVSFSLILICLFILPYVGLNLSIEVTVIISCIIAGGFACLYFNKAFIVLVYLLGEYFINVKEIKYANVIIITLAIIFTYKNEEFLEILFINILSILVISYVSHQNRRISYLESQWENNRKIAYVLDSKIKSMEKYTYQEKENIKLQERNDLAGKMHDRIGHTISAAILQLEALSIIVKKDSNVRAVEITNNISRLLRKGIDEIRATIRNVKPASEELGINKIKILLEEKVKNTDLKYYITSQGNIDIINTYQWKLIVEAIRELSTNSLKYSKGNIISVNIETFNKVIKVEFKDNGVGCKKIVKGVGLQSLEEKLVSVDGRLILEGSKGFIAIIILKIGG